MHEITFIIQKIKGVATVRNFDVITNYLLKQTMKMKLWVRMFAYSTKTDEQI
jgi:hypothetical protein